MSLFLPLLALFGTAACLPGWRYARRRQRASHWSLLIIVPGLLAWLALASAGIGPQGLSNLVMELFDLTIGTIGLYYFKVMLLDRINQKPEQNSVLLVTVSMAAALLLRLLMPEFME